MLLRLTINKSNQKYDVYAGRISHAVFQYDLVLQLFKTLHLMRIVRFSRKMSHVELEWSFMIMIGY